MYIISLNDSGNGCSRHDRLTVSTLEPDIDSISSLSLSKAHCIMLFSKTQYCHCDSTQGSYPFSETNIQDFSRTQIDFSRALKFT